MSITWNFSLSGQTITTESTFTPVEYTKNVYTAVFDPGNDPVWSSGEADGNIFAVFLPNKGSPAEILLTDYECSIPQDVLFSDFVSVGAVLRLGNKVYPTKFTGQIRVADGAYLA